MDSVSINSTNHGWRMLGEKNPGSSEKQNLNLPGTGDYLQSIYFVLGIISNLEMI